MGKQTNSSIQQEETTEDGMAGLQSKFQNLKAKVNQNVDRRIDKQTDIINPQVGIALQSGQKLCFARYHITVKLH